MSVIPFVNVIPAYVSVDLVATLHQIASVKTKNDLVAMITNVMRQFIASL